MRLHAVLMGEHQCKKKEMSGIEPEISVCKLNHLAKAIPIVTKFWRFSNEKFLRSIRVKLGSPDVRFYKIFEIRKATPANTAQNLS